MFVIIILRFYSIPTTMILQVMMKVLRILNTLTHQFLIQQLLIEEENVVHREEEEVDLEDISQVQDVVLLEKLFSITRLIFNIESLNDNSTPDRALNSFESDNSLLDNFLPEFETFYDHLEETRSGNTTHDNYSLPEYDSFCFEIEPDQERLINLMKNDVPDNSSRDPLLEEADLFLFDDSIPPGIENVADDPEGDVYFLEELLIGDFILSHELSDDNNLSISPPPPEPPDVESFFHLKPDMIAEEISDKLNEDKCFDSGGEIFVSTNNEDVDYFPFMFVIRIFLPYLILPEISPLFLSAESEDTIFDPEPPDVETDAGEEIPVVMIVKDKFDDDYQFFMFDKVFSLLSAKSEDTIFDPVEPEFRTIVTMADNRTMAQMLQAPIEGYEDAIVVPQINANNFELKQTLINLVQSNQFTGRQDPHNHLRFFNKVTSTFIHPETTYLQNEIINFLQKPNDTFNEAWESFKDLLRQCHHHGFSELHQLDTFYNALNPNDQDALDSAAGGNFLDKIPRECLSIIESKSKFRYSRSRVTDIAASLEDKLDIRMNRFEKSLNDMKNSFITPTAPLKAVEETAAVGNFIQNRNQNVSNQMRPLGFNQPTHQNNN
uniref:Retrotransposon gag domain-containing protein n=1 Tax=Tanacetum cinerariifolium TaxID=118510 RepID=A0A699IU36_TANCI|nr:hypothetical protein [Tanacetum cinerariifolium]